MTKEFQTVNLGEYGDPNCFNEPLQLEDFDAATLLKLLRKMIMIRKAEEKLGDKIVDGAVTCPCHLAIGQEAIAVGLASVARKTDRIFGAHRSHAHFLALNEDLYGLFAEILGKESGSSKGMGGSMHLIDNANGFKGSVPIVGATIPLATGAAMAAKFDGDNDLAVTFFGDGATEEGGFHESLNLASTYELPVLYICENNSSHMHVSLRQPTNTTARYADAHLIKNKVVDGNDVVAMAKVCQEASDYIRTTNKPFFIEAVTYRWRGHEGPREDMDVGVKRKANLANWKKRDPIGRLEQALIQNNYSDKEEITAIYKEMENLIESNWKKAEKAAYPDVSALLDLVYSK